MLEGLQPAAEDTRSIWERTPRLLWSSSSWIYRVQVSTYLPLGFSSRGSGCDPTERELVQEAERNTGLSGRRLLQRQVYLAFSLYQYFVCSGARDNNLLCAQFYYDVRKR